ncbi:MAG: gliding motility-associated C-terminal domain-containing protein [Saprospiraceae bacterium]|nr:gliding motility-associated C-terminal domain-containing protein [Lewinellaceae bacterium]
MKSTLTVLCWWLAIWCLPAQNGVPQIQLAVTDISCAGNNDGKIELTLLSGALPVSFQWANLNTGASGTGQFTLLNQPLNLSNLMPGMYQFNFNAADGTDTIIQRLVHEPLPLQGKLVSLTNFGGFQITCADGADGRVLFDVTGGTPPLSYTWTNGDQGSRADSLSAGPVSVTVTDNRGCTLSADTVLSAPTPIISTLDALGEICLDQNTGRISIETVSGGVPPYLYSLNDDPAGSQTSWSNLPDGYYFVHIEDAVGCVQTEAAILPSGLEFVLELSNDTSMLTGDTLRLPYYSDPPADTLIWSPATGVQVFSQGEVLLFPQFSTTYHVTAISAEGCVAEDDIRIEVSRDRDVYVPNVFAPAALDPENQRFSVYGSAGIRTVALFQVFDRFGRLWFENRNFPVNDATAGWDGTQGADEAPVGVYLWRAVLHYTDGREHRLQGDVTVIR